MQLNSLILLICIPFIIMANSKKKEKQTSIDGSKPRGATSTSKIKNRPKALPPKAKAPRSTSTAKTRTRQQQLEALQENANRLKETTEMAIDDDSDYDTMDKENTDPSQIPLPEAGEDEADLMEENSEEEDDEDDEIEVVETKTKNQQPPTPPRGGRSNRSKKGDNTNNSTPENNESLQENKRRKTSEDKDDDSDDEEMKTPPPAAPRVSIGETTTKVFNTAEENLKRASDIYMSLIIQMPPTKANERVGRLAKILQFIMQTLHTIDPNAVLYKYDDTPRKEITMANILYGGSSTAFPNNLAAMKRFFDNLSVPELEKQFLSIRIGTDKDPLDFACSGNELLKEALDKDNADSCNTNLYIKRMQVPHTKDIGWITGMPSNCNAADFQEALQQSLDKLHESKIIKNRLPVQVYAKKVRLSFNNTAKKMDNNKDDNDLRTFHIEVPRGSDKKAQYWVHKAIKVSPLIKGRSNMTLTWVPTIDKDSSPDNVSYSNRAFAYHKSIIASTDFSYVPGIQNLNVTSERLGGKTLRQLILGLKLPSNKKEHIFIMAETGYNGDAILYYAKKWASEAKQVIKYLILYLQKAHKGNEQAVLHGFTQEAIEDNEDYYWDKKNNCPASRLTKELEQNLDAAKKSNHSWVFECLDIVKENDNKAPDRPQKKQQMDDASFKSQGVRDDASDAADSGAANPNAAGTNADLESASEALS